MINYFLKKQEKKNIFWWEPKNGKNNAGDHLGKVIVQAVLSTYDKTILDKKTSKNKLLSIGSVMHFANDGDCIWGTGINGKIDKSKLSFSQLDVRAVRGPHSRNILINEKKINVPEVYGDPGLLLPLFYSRELLVEKSKIKDFIIIPHMNENFETYAKFKSNVCSPVKGALEFTRDIVNSKFVISSSLHGVIIAEAYGIPAVFLHADSGESLFKYDDYYNGTGRDYYAKAMTVEDAFKMKTPGIDNLSEIQHKLLEAFPLDLW